MTQDSAKQQEHPFPHVLRTALGLMLILYGVSKIAGIQFQDNPSHSTHLVKELNGMQLVWAFFAFSRGYTFCVGIVQVLASVLLLLRKTAAVGAIAYLTVMVNVVLIDLWYAVNRQATTMACLLFLGVVLWMWLERRRYFQALDILLVSPQQMSEPVHRNRFLVPILAIVLLVVTTSVLSFLTNPINGPLR